MTSQFEKDNGCDFDSLDEAQCRAALRLFANAYPQINEGFSEYLNLLHGCSDALAKHVSIADAETCKRLCEEYATNVNKLSGALVDLMKLHAHFLGEGLGNIGLQSENSLSTAKKLN